MADTKDIIIKFHKTSSEADRAKTVADLKNKGAQVKNEDNVNSKIFPFIALSLPEDHFSDLQSLAAGGHDVVAHVEEDGEMRTQ